MTGVDSRHPLARPSFQWGRLICLIGSPLWWFVAGSLHGRAMAGCSLVATVYTLPIAYWLGGGRDG